MKTQLKKIIIGAAALLFVMTGVSFAHDGGSRHQKPQGKAHGYYKVEKHHQHWQKNHPKFTKLQRDRYRVRKVNYHHHDKIRRQSPRGDLIYKISLKDAGILFKVILK